MARRTHVLIAAAIATTCVHCSLLLYNEEELTEGPLPSVGVDASPETNAPDVTARDASADASDADAWTLPDAAVVWSANGHAYEVVVANEIDWHAAKEAAAERGGHLVTITTDAENDFVFTLAKPAGEAWKYESGDDLSLGPWIGCIQAPGSIEPDGGFGWITGEPFAYESFGNGQPDDSAGENACHFFSYGELEAVWNDNASTLPLAGYIVEYE